MRILSSIYAARKPGAFTKVLGEELRDLRLDRDWTIAKVSTMTGIPHAAISRYEAGNGGQLERLQSMADVYGYSLSQLILRTERRIAQAD